ncbi:MAG: UvrD-helicase domain-containing protein [Gemmatimonadaceae bacterium]
MTIATINEQASLAALNPAQRAAVLHFEGPMLVVAGAGSGKTRVLTSRIARLIDHHGVDPAAILAVTFTNKAAGEMRARIEGLLARAPVGMWVGTFHAVGARMLRSFAAAVGRTSTFTIYDEDDLIAVVKRLMERHRVSPREIAPKAIVGMISEAKNQLITPGEFEANARMGAAKLVAAVYRDLEGALRNSNAAGFDDLLVLPVQALDADSALLARWRARFRFVLVDEYQDTNRAQYRLIRLIAGDRGNVCVVGDDDQSIYGWRGADLRNILDFEKDFPAAAVVRLEDNYRSTPSILQVANAVISLNVDRRGKVLRSTRPDGDRVTLIGAVDERDEADVVVGELRAQRSRAPHIAFSDAAVLYRTNAQSRALEDALRREGIPHRLVGAVRFYDRREIRDLISYLKLIANPADDEAFRRAVSVPRRGLGDATIDALAEKARAAGIPLLAAAVNAEGTAGLRPAQRGALAQFAALIREFRDRAEESSVDEILRALVNALRYADYLAAEGLSGAERLENVRELIAGASETVADDAGELGLRPLDHFLQRATLVADVDSLDRAADAVTLMTIHNAKGLEFPVVFVTGLEDGLFPIARAFDNPKLLEEERRLFYVAITRAERTLFLTFARSRRRNGETLPSIPSSFLSAIPRSAIDERSTMKLRATGRGGLPTAPSQRRPGVPIRVDLFRTRQIDESEASQDSPRYVKGERVRHGRFGSGTIAELTGLGRDTKVTIDFDDEGVGRKRLVVAYAGLERGCE